MNWINVKDELPSNDRTVLFYGKDKEVWVASCLDGQWWIDEFGKTNDVLFWMELPIVNN